MTYRIPEGIEIISKEWVNEHIDKNKVTKIVCPSSLVEIGFSTFSNYTNLKEIILNDGLKYIDVNAFRNTGITKIKLPSSLIRIDWYVFSDCKYLKEVVLNEGLEYIGKYAFQNAGITSIKLPSSLKAIRPFAFDQCSYLKEVKLNEGLECIGTSAFKSTGIISVTIPNSLKETGMNLFSNCSKLEKIIIGDKSFIAMLNEYEYILRKMFDSQANIIIKNLDDEIDYNLFNNIKKVSDEEKHRLGLELFDVINKDEIDLKKVQKLLINGADTEIRDSNGNTGLMLMIKKGSNEASMMYLLSGSDVNAKNKLKETPLILASRSNNNDIAFELIDRNCIVNAMSVLDESALSIAYDNGNIELVSRLEDILNISSKEKELEGVAKIRKKILGGMKNGI